MAWSRCQLSLTAAVVEAYLVELVLESGTVKAHFLMVN